jgi:regulator of protease activity HflC (stomatin/prohibitin superfamily)
MEEIRVPPRLARIPSRIILAAGLVSLLSTVVVDGAARLPFIVALAGSLVLAKGLFSLNPGSAAVLSLFGKYVGTVRALDEPVGRWYWVNPFYRKVKTGLWGQIQSAQLKVNDLEGSPIEISANISYVLEDTAKAHYNLEQHWNFVRLQSEAGLRTLAMRHAYDVPPGAGFSLRGDPGRAAAELREEIQSHFDGSGIRINTARIVHLAYAPEIAALMLQRQQADATVAAARATVENAVLNVETAVRLVSAGVDAATRAQWVHDLMISLCSHQPARPIVEISLLHGLE